MKSRLLKKLCLDGLKKQHVIPMVLLVGPVERTKVLKNIEESADQITDKLKPQVARVFRKTLVDIVMTTMTSGACDHKNTRKHCDDD